MLMADLDHIVERVRHTVVWARGHRGDPDRRRILTETEVDLEELLNALHELILLLKIHLVAVVKSQQRDETRKPITQYAYMEEASRDVDVSAV